MCPGRSLICVSSLHGKLMWSDLNGRCADTSGSLVFVRHMSCVVGTCDAGVNCGMVVL